MLGFKQVISRSACTDALPTRPPRRALLESLTSNAWTIFLIWRDNVVKGEPSDVSHGWCLGHMLFSQRDKFKPARSTLSFTLAI